MYAGGQKGDKVSPFPKITWSYTVGLSRVYFELTSVDNVISS